MNLRRFSYTAATAGFFAAVLIAFQSVPLASVHAAPGAPPMDTAHLKALYSEKCAICHELHDPVTEPETPMQWRRTVNIMMVRDNASEFITNDEATAIVGYLASFAPRNRGRVSLGPWDTDTLDVWTAQPSHSRVFNFETGTLTASLAPLTGGAGGPDAAWRTVPTPGVPDGTFIKETPAKPDASRFALLVNNRDTGRSVDTKVRFQMMGGRVSPSVGIAFGLSGSKNYTVLRYDALHNAVVLLKVSEPAHTALQTTPLPADPKLVSQMNAGWHTLRLLVKDGQIRGWLDGTKRIAVSDPSYTGGKVALWTQGDTIAGFDDWTVDFYDAASAPAS